MTQTAIQWLIDELSAKHASARLIFSANKDLIEKAKSKERQDLIDAHCSGQDIEDTCGVQDAEQYVHEKFGI